MSKLHKRDHQHQLLAKDIYCCFKIMHIKTATNIVVYIETLQLTATISYIITRAAVHGLDAQVLSKNMLCLA
uniref:Uncharacterized protein n=1 Tax=Acrobeloides nanus TaxID=290746 RepID=A0A914CLU2_9BILA